MGNMTVIYYTANKENPKFEKRIRDNILKQTDLPIISVSQEPIDFGHNICVGKQPHCYSNSFKQLLIGLKEAKTKYCIAAESDCLYPPEYFTFAPPPEGNVYRYANVRVYFEGKGGFWRKPWSEGAQVCDREYWIKSIERTLDGHEGWEPITDKRRLQTIFQEKDEFSWTSANPVITFKTRNGVNFKTGFEQGIEKKLDYWGSVVDIERRMFS